MTDRIINWEEHLTEVAGKPSWHDMERHRSAKAWFHRTRRQALAVERTVHYFLEKSQRSPVLLGPVLESLMESRGVHD